MSFEISCMPDIFWNMHYIFWEGLLKTAMIIFVHILQPTSSSQSSVHFKRSHRLLVLRLEKNRPKIFRTHSRQPNLNFETARSNLNLVSVQRFNENYILLLTKRYSPIYYFFISFIVTVYYVVIVQTAISWSLIWFICNLESNFFLTGYKKSIPKSKSEFNEFFWPIATSFTCLLCFFVLVFFVKKPGEN